MARHLLRSSLLLLPATAQQWQLLINQAPPASLQSNMPYGVTGFNGPYIFSANASQCATQTGNSWTIFDSRGPECVSKLGPFTPITASVTGSWYVLGTPQVPNETACNGTGFVYISSSICASSGGGQDWVQMSRYPAWAANGPRYGHQIQYTYQSQGLVMLGGFNATPGPSYGAPLNDVWYTGGSAFYYDTFYQGASIPPACFDATSGSPRYASFTVTDRSTAGVGLYLLCGGGGGGGAAPASAPWLYYLQTNMQWGLVGVTRGLSVATGGGADFSLRFSNGVSPAMSIGQIIINVRADGSEAAAAFAEMKDVRLISEGENERPAGLFASGGRRRAQAAGSPSPSSTPAANNPNLPARYGCLVAAGGGTGGIATSVDGVTWRYFNSTMAGAYGSRRINPALVTDLNANRLFLIGGRGDCLFNDSTTATASLDPVCTDTWTLPPETCCVTGYNSSTGGYELCSGKGDCTPYSRDGFCTCWEGASGAYCEVGVPTTTPAGTPSMTPSREKSRVSALSLASVSLALAGVAASALLLAH